MFLGKIFRGRGVLGFRSFLRWTALNFFAFAIFIPSGAALAGTEFSAWAFDFYPQGAKFVFRLEADGRFEFTLPGAFAQGDIRCLTREKLVFFRTETVPVKETEPTEVQALRQKASEAERSVKLLEAREAALNQALTMLQIMPSFGGEDNKKIDVEAWIEYIASARKIRLDAGTELVEVNMDALMAREELQKRREELESLRAELERNRPFNASLSVKVEGFTSGPAVLSFEAYTPAAGWGLEYDMNLDSATGDIETKMSAAVWQNTGMDAEGDFSFHTRELSQVVSPPEVRPLTVGLRVRPAPVSSNYDLAPMAALPMREAHDGAAMDLTSSLKPAPEAISTLADVTLKGGGKIEGNGRPNRVALGEFEMKSVPLLVAVPEQNKNVWIVASLDSVPEAFLPGVVELAVDGSSTGRTRIRESLSGRLSFGTASRLAVKKELHVSRAGSSWTGAGILNDGYSLEVTNGWDTEREVTVRDRIPVPTVDKVTLEVTKIDPATTERDAENRLAWKINVKPGETKKIIVEYTLRYPGGETLEYR